MSEKVGRRRKLMRSLSISETGSLEAATDRYARVTEASAAWLEEPSMMVRIALSCVLSGWHSVGVQERY